MVTRRDALRRGLLACGGVAVAGCAGGGDGPLLSEGFETGLDPWETRGHVGPDAGGEFQWTVERSDAEAHEGAWSLRVFTEGRFDDGTAWAVRPIDVPAGASGLRVSLMAWSPSESFNLLRHLVAAARPEPPETEADFPDPGANSTGIEGAPYGGLREPLHQAAGWREYGFEWTPERMPERVHLAVGVSVVWEADATHFVDEVVARTL
ncbi:MAG: hypothetical protein ABEH47_09050 [Haloferacaceae archaeon]